MQSIALKSIYSEATMQRSLARFFDYHTQLVCIPNVSLFDWEMDFCLISKALVITEVEIKISLADWNNDKTKDKWKSGHRDKIGRFYYAVPHHLVAKLPQWVPESTGVISVGTDDEGRLTKVREVVREAKLVSKYRASNRDVEYLYRGAYLRFWDKKAGIL